jgi:molybdate transport system regulatory protein
MPRQPRRAKPQTPALRARLWVEIGRHPALSEPGADLLEQIDACGSLSESARRLRFSYRRAWMLIDAMNRRWPTPLVRTATGGKRGGGSRLTERGRLVLRAYRDLQLHAEAFLDTATADFLAGLEE